VAGRGGCLPCRAEKLECGDYKLFWAESAEEEEEEGGGGTAGSNGRRLKAQDRGLKCADHKIKQIPVPDGSESLDWLEPLDRVCAGVVLSSIVILVYSGGRIVQYCTVEYM